MEIKLNDFVSLKKIGGKKWTVSYIENDKIYCYKELGGKTETIVVHKSLLYPYVQGRISVA